MNPDAPQESRAGVPPARDVSASVALHNRVDAFAAHG